MRSFFRSRRDGNAGRNADQPGLKAGRGVVHYPAIIALVLVSLSVAGGSLLAVDHSLAAAAAPLLLAAILILAGWLFWQRMQLRRCQTDFELILNNTGLRITYKDANNRFLRVNEKAAAFHGCTVEQAIGKSVYDLAPQYAKARHEEDLEVIRSGKPMLGEVKEMGVIDGVVQWGRADKMPYADPVTGEDRILVVSSDVTAQVNAEIALRRSEERYNLAIEMSAIGTWDWDVRSDDKFWSPRMRAIVGLPDSLPAPRNLDFEGRLHPDDRDRVIAARRDHLADREPYIAEFRLLHEDGHYVWVRSRGQAVWHESGAPVRMAGSLEDITARVELEQRLERLAHFDPLTSLYNRTVFQERLQDVLDTPRDTGGVALLALDLDGFKSINDTFGHCAGDRLLTEVGERLRACTGPNDVVARLGGDEFAIVHTSDEPLLSADLLAERVMEEICRPYETDQRQAIIGASIGIAVVASNRATIETIMHRADLALYYAKQEGRGTYRFFEAAMEESVRDRNALAVDLRHAIARSELSVHYQPIIDVRRDEISGCEALLRWRHPERGWVPPSEFIAIAQEAGLINLIGEWVLIEACREAATWPEHLRIAVNVSPLQFTGGTLMPALSTALARSGLDARRLELEITETVLMSDNDASGKMLRQFRGLGIQVALDDFGTGYSSLNYLQSFPIDRVKIDASFIKKAVEHDVGIVHAIVTIASKLGLATTAEGIETEAQMDLVRAQGCGEAQGYLFSRPLPAEGIRRLLSAVNPPGAQFATGPAIPASAA